MEDRIKSETSVEVNETERVGVRERNGSRPRGKGKKTTVKTEIF